MERLLESAEYARELNAQFTYLFEWARSVGELDMAASLFGEFRGAQDAGWSTAITAYEVRDELQEIDKRGARLNVAELRQVLCLYSQLAEAGGVYEGLLNLIRVIQLKPYKLWPFRDLVRIKQSPKRIIGPNANAMFRRLADTASEIGLRKLSELLEIAFRDDIRNAISHADYIIGPDGLRLRRRNGGQVIVVTYDEINVALTNGLNFFQLLEAHQQSARESFYPARTIIGRFSQNPPMPYVVEMKPNGGFSISTEGIGRQTDASYVRQERINNLLCGRVLAAYLNVNKPGERAAFDGIRQAGFEPTLVEIATDTQLSEVIDETTRHGLWHQELGASDGADGLLIVSPSGVMRVLNASDFLSKLPTVDALEFSS